MWHRGSRACGPLSQPPVQAVGVGQEQSAEREGEEMEPGYIWPAVSSLSVRSGRGQRGTSGRRGGAGMAGQQRLGCRASRPVGSGVRGRGSERLRLRLLVRPP